MIARLVAAAALALALAGCSIIKPYPNAGPRNLEVRVNHDEGEAFVTVHRVTGPCAVDYQGTLDVGQGTHGVALPEGQPLLVVLGFEISSFLGGSKSFVRREFPVTPRAGHRYEASMQYRKRQYEVTLAEVDARGRRRDLPPAGLDCPGK